MVDPADTMNCAFFEGKDIPVPEMLDLADTMPFLAPRRVIVVEDSGFFKNGQEKLAEFFRRIPPTTHFIFLETEVNKSTKTYKEAAKCGYIAELNEMPPATLKKWILSRFQSAGYRITGGAMELFLQYTGSDMNRIDTELEKLFAYKAESKEVREEDVEEITCRNIENHIFVMTDAAARQNRDRALQEYYDLLALKVDSGFILSQVIRQINLMYQARSMKMKGYDLRTMSQKMGLADWITKKYLQNSDLYTIERLRKLLEQGCELIEKQRNGLIQDKMAVELFLIDASNKKR